MTQLHTFCHDAQSITRGKLGYHAFTPNPDPTPASDFPHFHSGWKVIGFNLQFVPSEPLLDSDQLLDQVDSESGVSRKVALGLGIGVGVGGGLLAALAVPWALMLLSRRRKLAE